MQHDRQEDRQHEPERPSEDRREAMRQNRDDLDTHEFVGPRPTAEEQTRGQRHDTKEGSPPSLIGKQGAEKKS